MKIVCLSGSTKFKKEFEEINKQETLKGNIVLTVGFFMHQDKIQITKKQKEKLDELHLRKIDMCEELIVICPNNYIGESTRNEIEYAKKLCKKIRFETMNGIY